MENYQNRDKYQAKGMTELRQREDFGDIVNKFISIYHTKTNSQICDELNIKKGTFGSLRKYVAGDEYATNNGGNRIELSKKRNEISEGTKLAVLDDYQDNSDLTVSQIAKKHGISTGQVYALRNSAQKLLRDYANNYSDDELGKMYNTSECYVNYLKNSTQGTNHLIKRAQKNSIDTLVNEINESGNQKHTYNPKSMNGCQPLDDSVSVTEPIPAQAKTYDHSVKQGPILPGILKSSGLEGYDSKGKPIKLGRNKSGLVLTHTLKSNPEVRYNTGKKGLAESLALTGNIERLDGSGAPQYEQANLTVSTKNKGKLLRGLAEAGSLEIYNSENNPVDIVLAGSEKKKQSSLKKLIVSGLVGLAILGYAKTLSNEPGLPKQNAKPAINQQIVPENPLIVPGENPPIVVAEPELPKNYDDPQDASTPDTGKADTTPKVIVPHRADKPVVPQYQGRRKINLKSLAPAPIAPAIDVRTLDDVKATGIPSNPAHTSSYNPMPELNAMLSARGYSGQYIPEKATATVRIANLKLDAMNKYTNKGNSLWSSKDNTVEIPAKCLEDITTKVSTGRLFKKNVPFSSYVLDKQISVVKGGALSSALYRDNDLSEELSVSVNGHNGNSAFDEVAIEYDRYSDFVQVVLKIDNKFGDNLTRLYSVGIRDENGTVRKVDVQKSTVFGTKTAAWGVSQNWLEGLVLEDKNGKEKINHELKPICGAEVIACNGAASDDAYLRISLPKSYLQGGHLPEILLGWTFDTSRNDSFKAGMPDMPSVRTIRGPASPTGGGSMGGGDEIGPSGQTYQPQAPIGGGGMSGGDEF